MTTSKPMHILYIEDDAVMARLTQMKLEKLNYVVDIARDGREGINKFKNKSYDVVLVEYQLPYYDGLQIIQEISKNGSSPPIIMVTGAGSESIAVEAMKLGAGDYLVKDVDSGFLNILPTIIKHVWSQNRLKDEKAQAISALRKSEENLNDFFDHAVELIHQVSPDGKFIYVNNTWANKLGYSKEESAKINFFDIFHPEHSAMSFEIIDRVKAKETVKNFETVFITKDGREMNVLLNISGQFKNGEFVCARGMGHDITERKQAENEREQLINQLKEALAEVKVLSGMLPICASCKKIRDDKGYWNQIEIYIKDHSDAEFTHSICPECKIKLYPELSKQVEQGKDKTNGN